MAGSSSKDGFNPDNPYGSRSVTVSDQQQDGMEAYDPENSPEADDKGEDQTADKGKDKAEDDGDDDVPAMPEGGYEKFYNSETGDYNWQAHAKEAEFKAAQAAKKGNKQKDAGEDAGEDDGSDDDDEDGAKNAVEDAGLNWEDLGSKLHDKGDIDEGDYEALEKAGIPRDVAEQYVRGFNTEAAQAAAQAQEYIQNALGMDDADEATDTLMDWAGKNLEEDEVDSYNEMLQSPQWKVALDSLTARYQSANQNSDRYRGGGKAAGNSNSTYQNQNEVIEAMKDPRYKPDSPKFDPEYRQKVVEKLARSDVSW